MTNEVLIGILSLVLAAVGAYFAYKQLKASQLPDSHTRGTSMSKPQGNSKPSDEILALKRRRLHELKKKQALQGINTPPEVLIEIEELEKELDNRERNN